jgi:hypothetical protein
LFRFDFTVFLQNQQQYDEQTAVAIQQAEAEEYESNKNRSLQNGGDRDASIESKAPCLNCRLIQMGSAISYGDNRCPQCGEYCG